MATTTRPTPRAVRNVRLRYWRIVISLDDHSNRVGHVKRRVLLLMRTTDEIPVSPARVCRGTDCARADHGHDRVLGDRRLPALRRVLHDSDHGVDGGLCGDPPAEPGRARIQLFFDFLWRHHDVFRHWGDDAKHY